MTKDKEKILKGMLTEKSNVSETHAGHKGYGTVERCCSTMEKDLPHKKRRT